MRVGLCLKKLSFLCIYKFSTLMSLDILEYSIHHKSKYFHYNISVAMGMWRCIRILCLRTTIV